MMSNVDQLRNRSMFGSSLGEWAILEIADRLEKLEHEVKELKTKNLQPAWPADVSSGISDEPLPAITIGDIFPQSLSDNPKDVDYSKINK